MSYRPALCCLLLSSAASAGTTLTWDRVRASEETSMLVMKCEGGNARFEGTAGGGRVVIWDAAAKTLDILRPADKTYAQLTEARVNELRERARASMEKMKEKLEKMPPEQRAKLEELMGAGDAAAEWKFTPTGKKAKIGKWDCEWYDGVRGSVKMQSCMVPWASAPARKEDLECVKSAAATLGSLTRGLARDGEAAPEDITKFPGIPVQTVRELPDGKKNVTTLKSIEHGPVPADAFKVPSGYTLKEQRESPPPPP